MSDLTPELNRRASLISLLAEELDWTIDHDNENQLIIYTGIWEGKPGEYLYHPAPEFEEDTPVAELLDYNSTTCISCGGSVVGEIFTLVNDRPVCAKCIP